MKLIYTYTLEELKKLYPHDIHHNSEFVYYKTEARMKINSTGKIHVCKGTNSLGDSLDKRFKCFYVEPSIEDITIVWEVFAKKLS